MANRVVHFEIEVKDIEKAKRFYSDAFGWEMQDQGQEDYGGYVVAKSGESNELGINGGIFKPEGQKELNSFRCVIGVEDIHKAIEDVKKAGGKVIEEQPTNIPKVGLFARCEDTEGNRFAVLQPDLSSMPQA